MIIVSRVGVFVSRNGFMEFLPASSYKEKEIASEIKRIIRGTGFSSDVRVSKRKFNSTHFEL